MTRARRDNQALVDVYDIYLKKPLQIWTYLAIFFTFEMLQLNLNYANKKPK